MRGQARLDSAWYSLLEECRAFRSCSRLAGLLFLLPAVEEVGSESSQAYQGEGFVGDGTVSAGCSRLPGAPAPAGEGSIAVCGLGLGQTWVESHVLAV